MKLRQPSDLAEYPALIIIIIRTHKMCFHVSLSQRLRVNERESEN